MREKYGLDVDFIPSFTCRFFTAYQIKSVGINNKEIPHEIDQWPLDVDFVPSFTCQSFTANQIKSVGINN